MADRSVVVKLKAEIAQYQSAMKAAGLATEGIGKAAQKSEKDTRDLANMQKRAAHEMEQDTRHLANMQMEAAREMAAAQDKAAQERSEAMTKVGTGLLAIGAVAAAGVGLAVSKFADFDQAMSRAAAGTQATGAALGALRDAAIKGGQATQFSATEAAQAITEMGKAGVSTKDILGGGLTGALSLAAAGELDVGRAGEIAATAMNQFALEGKDLPHVADLLAAGAGKAMGSVEDLAGALVYVGPVAKGLGVSIEETTGVLAEFASNGVLGEKAGTALRGMMMSLTSPSQIAAGEMKTLGLNVYDSTGKFIGMQGVAGQLADKMGVLSNAERDASFGRLFGNETITAARILYSGGAKDVSDWTDKVNDSGFAARQAAALTDNLRGDIERLGGSIDTALISSGSAANDALRSMTQAAEGAVNAFVKLPQPVQNTALVVGAVVGAVGLLGGGFMVLLPKIAETKKALETLKISTAALKSGLGIAGGALAVGVIGLGLYANAQNEARNKVDALALSLDEQTGALTDNSTAWISSELTKDQSFGINNTKSMAEAADQMGISLETLTRAYEGQPGAVAAAKDAAQEWMDSNFSLSQSNEGMAQRFIRNIDDQSVRLKDARDVVATKKKIDEEATVAQGGLAESYDYATKGAEAQTAATEEEIKALEDWMKMVSEADASFINLGGAWDAVIKKNTDVATSTAESTKSSKDSWEDYYDGVSVSTDAYLKELEGQMKAQQDWEKNIILLSGRASQAVVDAFIDMGVEGAPILAEFVNSSDKEMARLETVYGQRTTEATTVVAKNIKDAGPVIAAAGAQLGKKAADEIADKLAKGEITVQQAINQYHLTGVTVPVDVDTNPGQAQLNAWIAKNNARAVAMPGLGGNKIRLAEGGAVSGPGTGTSDDVPIMGSNGEHMWTAREVQDVGGQEAMYRLRAKARAGELHLAKGGAVEHIRVPVTVDTSGWATEGGAGAVGAHGGTLASLVSFGRMLQQMGYSVSEHPAFGGVHSGHMAGSKHYSGRAIDVNRGAGTSASEQRYLDAIVSPAHAAGLGTIWRAPGHFNHLHAEYDQGGMLPPGYTSVYNGTGRPEAVFTEKQLAALTSGNGGAGVRVDMSGTFYSYDPHAVARAANNRMQDAMAAYGIGR